MLPVVKVINTTYRTKTSLITTVTASQPIAIVIFIVLKAFMKMKKKFEKPEEPKEEEAPAETELDVLKEIRDSLANGRNDE